MATKLKWSDRMTELSAAVDGQLQEFVTDGTGEGMAPEHQIQNRIAKKKRKKVVRNAAVGVGGALAIGAAGAAAAKHGGVRAVAKKGLEGAAGKIDRGVSRSYRAAGMMTDRAAAAARLKRASKLGKVGSAVRKVAKNFSTGTVRQLADQLMMLEARIAHLEE